MTISISISILFKSVDISTIDMSYRYIEQGYGWVRCRQVWGEGVGRVGAYEECLRRPIIAPAHSPSLQLALAGAGDRLQFRFSIWVTNSVREESQVELIMKPYLISTSLKCPIMWQL